MSRRRSNISLTALIVMLMTVMLACAPAQAAKRMEVGLQDDGAFVSEVGLKRSKALNLAEQLEVTRIRVNIQWAKVVNSPGKKKRPKKRRYDFASYDALVNAAKRRGMKLQVNLTGMAPAWATNNHKVGGDRPNTKYFKEFARAVVKHFRKHVDRYAIWNEPNYKAWLGPSSASPKLYHKIYETSYDLIRKYNPKAKILIGETAPYGQEGRSTPPLEWLRKLAKYGRLRADGYAHHPYDFRHSVTYDYPGSDNVTISGLSRLTKQLDKLKKQKKLLTPKGKALDVYLTEYGYMRSGKYKVSEKTRAKYLTKAFEYALGNSRVKQMTQYLLVKPPWHRADFDTGLVSRKKGKPGKAFRALAKWAKQQAQKHKILVARKPKPARTNGTVPAVQPGEAPQPPDEAPQPGPLPDLPLPR
jgi:GH35 family endo-1,4-beta-xylanase